MLTLVDHLGYLRVILDHSPAPVALGVTHARSTGKLIYRDGSVASDALTISERQYLYHRIPAAGGRDQPVNLLGHHGPAANHTAQHAFIGVLVVRPGRPDQGTRVGLGLQKARNGARLEAMNPNCLALERHHGSEERGICGIADEFVHPLQTARQAHLAVTRAGKVDTRRALGSLDVGNERAAEPDLVPQLSLSPAEPRPLCLQFRSEDTIPLDSAPGITTPRRDAAAASPIADARLRSAASDPPNRSP